MESNWSIYAYLPFIWLGLILFYGLIRSAYEIKIEKIYFQPVQVIETHFDAIEFRDQKLYTDLFIRCNKDPQQAIMDIHREIAFNIMNRVKAFITFTKTRVPSQNITKIEGRIFVGRKR